MAEVKFSDVIKCSSEDMKHRSLNLLHGGGNQNPWMCSKDNNKSTIEVELQLEKEACISFIDIGNHGSQSVDILVSHSSRCKDEFFSLVPTFNFMSVEESKQGVNRSKVSMFQVEDMLTDTRTHSWDRIKLVCRQPYANGKQFGLSFVCVKMARNSSSNVSPKISNKNQNKLNSIFDIVKNENSALLKQPKMSMWSSPLSRNIGSSKSPKLKENRTPISPTDKNSQVSSASSKRTLSVGAIAQFREEVACFLDDVNFEELIQTKSIRVSDLRNQIEQQRGLALIRQQKILFMEIITEKLKEVKQRKVVNGHAVPSPIHSFKAKDVECDKCHTKLPRDVISIHRKMCVSTTPNRIIKPSQNETDILISKPNSTPNRVTTTPNETNVLMSKPSSTPNRVSSLTPLNRNRICFDMGSDDDDEGLRKRIKTSSSSTTNDSVPITVEDNTNDNVVGSSSLWDGAVKEIHNDVIISSPIKKSVTTECPICFKQIEVEKIETHASSCEGQVEQEEVDDLPEFPSSNQNQAKIVKSEVECPICGQMKDANTIEIHVNVCLDTSSG